MTAQAYQLTCDCGETHAVVTRQAGETISCKCGQTIEIPPLRAMRHLPSVESGEDSRPQPAWSRLQGSLFVVGLVISLSAIATIANYGWKRSKLRTDPLKVEDFEFARDVMALTPTQSWDAWTEAFRGEELGARNKPVHQISREYSRRYLRLIIVGGTFLVLGLASMMAAFLIKDEKR